MTPTSPRARRTAAGPDVLYTYWVPTREGAEKHQVMGGAALVDLAVVRVIAAPPAALQPHLLLESQITLGLQPSG